MKYFVPVFQRRPIEDARYSRDKAKPDISGGYSYDFNGNRENSGAVYDDQDRESREESPR